MKNQKNIYLVDDHEFVNNSIQNLLNTQNGKYIVRKIFVDGEELLNALNFEQPDLIITDVSMPKINGIELSKMIIKKFPNQKIMFLSMHKEMEYVRPAMATGAQGYVLKDSKPNEVFEAIDTILSGGNYISPKASSALIQNLKSKIELTPRELEVLKLIGKGKTTKDISDILCISSHTVESHRKNLLAKTDSTNVAELIIWSVGAGYIHIDIK